MAVTTRRPRRKTQGAATLQSERAYALLRGRILEMEYAPGSVLNETTLRRETGLGRTPIREALQRLAQEGLVQIVPRKGTFAAPLQVQDVRHIYELRLELEGLAARLAATRVTPEQAQRMRALVAQAQDPAGVDVGDFDGRFHALVAEASDNPYLRETLTRLYALGLRLLRLSNQTFEAEDLLAARPEYAAIVDAICTGDAARAERHLRQHIQTYPGQIVRYLTGTDVAAAPGRPPAGPGSGGPP